MGGREGSKNHGAKGWNNGQQVDDRCTCTLLQRASTPLSDEGKPPEGFNQGSDVIRYAF